MRSLPLCLIALALAACSGDPTTDDTDGSAVDDESGPHPLVPEEFSLLWNTSGECSNEFGDGDQIYMIGEGRLEADGTLSVTERVFWFYADEPRSSDCVDTFELTADSELVGSPQDLGYASGEHFYDVDRTRSEDNCSERYGRIYRSDEDGNLYQRLMFDTLNEFNDQPNEDNKIAVHHQERNWRGEGFSTKIYAQESGSYIEPDGEDFGPPATIRWIGKRCQVAFGGGGGGGGGGGS